MSWYKELGYKKNPLDTSIFKNTPEIVLYEKEVKELVYRIKSGNMALIQGPAGSGKSLLLKHLIDNFKGEGKVIYLDGNDTSKRLDIEEVLINSQDFKKRFFKQKPKNMILLMDNADQLTRKNNERIKYFYDQKYLKSVVFAVKGNPTFPKSILDRIGNRIFKLEKPTNEIARKITINRLGFDNLLNKTMIHSIFKLSKSNLSQHLINCQKVFEYMAEENKESVSEKELKQLLKTKISKEEQATNYCDDCGEKLKKIKSHWRCKECDLFCKKCGTMINEEDKTCPGCRAKVN